MSGAGRGADGPRPGSFVILESPADPDAYQLVSPDIATCEDCRRELLDPDDRRHGYPFTNCTNCGPRFTIIEDLPTTASARPCGFPCARPAGGSTRTRATAASMPSPTPARCAGRACGCCGWRRAARPVELAAGAAGDPAAPVRAAAELLRAGEILAVKGLGGFHLACDATDGEAVRRLKLRKRRPDKPLAVMFADLDQLRAHCRVERGRGGAPHVARAPDRAARVAGDRPAGETGPEVGRRRRSPTAAVHPEVAVRQRYLGAMLPYTPLHVCCCAPPDGRS